ncbi:class I SAM-dependent methyltransferase [Pigmentiphaga sp.]|uniref:class I SAM-dependent methyltransferase n=1 Tax=Pigmentiphaga sp. TaxID=1977564 RepID=UPI00128D4F9C|nr:class I SAM-dependent methyltransferase [Pigmentiphaga sp.]MPS26783.1 methyltransferase domain-containing protein [Alcaligenaceae bacterium SAGV5]MPS53808.1 methyltransferase domain-containing protein [Alcaligenaceae bacterium SAGV3]MPT60260.1 methyltransferase domain-containing protein [Alcaligenaceae bacterium]
MNALFSQAERQLSTLPVPVQLILPDGTRLGADQPRVGFTLKTLRSVSHLVRGRIGPLGEDYVEGRVDISGNMRDLMAAAAAIMTESPIDNSHPGWLSEMGRKATSVMRHTMDRDARQIQFHYDLSDDFYGLWQDPRRVYSCAYYRDSGMTLAQAQEAKLDHICRKLKLQAGERFLDIGAGWGGLLLWAAENYGVDATGITLSKNQHAHVNRLIEEKGLQDRVRMILLDYRQLEETRPYDKIASVGMFEHVGRAQLTGYFAKIRRLLRPGGMAMNHGITSGGTYNAQLGSGMGDFIEKYIFPGGELVHVSKVLETLSDGGLEAVDVENLRPHYARTLWAWSDGLEARLDDAHRVLPGEQGARSIRAYRLYLAGCAMAFERGWISLNQVLCQHQGVFDASQLDGPPSQAYPFRRDYIYR